MGISREVRHIRGEVKPEVLKFSVLSPASRREVLFAMVRDALPLFIDMVGFGPLSDLDNTHLKVRHTHPPECIKPKRRSPSYEDDLKAATEVMKLATVSSSRSASSDRQGNCFQVVALCVDREGGFVMWEAEFDTCNKQAQGKVTVVSRCWRPSSRELTSMLRHFRSRDVIVNAMTTLEGATRETIKALDARVEHAREVQRAMTIRDRVNVFA